MPDVDHDTREDNPHPDDAPSWGEFQYKNDDLASLREEEIEITKIRLFREDYERLDTTAEEEAERFDDDVDVTILDERPEPGPDEGEIDTDQLETVASRHVDADWTVDLDHHRLHVSGQTGPVNWILVWSVMRKDGAYRLDARTAGTLLEDSGGFTLAQVTDVELWPLVASTQQLANQLELALFNLREQTGAALRHRGRRLLEMADSLDD